MNAGTMAAAGESGRFSRQEVGCGDKKVTDVKEWNGMFFRESLL
jgi:hypothetical protein